MGEIIMKKLIKEIKEFIKYLNDGIESKNPYLEEMNKDKFKKYFDFY